MGVYKGKPQTASERGRGPVGGAGMGSLRGQSAAMLVVLTMLYEHTEDACGGFNGKSRIRSYTYNLAIP